MFIKIGAKNNEFDRKFQNIADISAKNAKISKHFCWNFEVWAVQTCANLVDLVKSFQTRFLLANFGVDTAENEPLKVSQRLEKS